MLSKLYTHSMQNELYAHSVHNVHNVQSV